jgi:molybdate transport system substrate-binding protein
MRGRARHRSARVALLAVAALLLGRADPAPAAGETLRVLAAASLSGAFRDLAAEFGRRHPGTEVLLGFAGSHTLAHQILEGAPADVFASADEATMADLRAAGAVSGEPRVFARNRLAIAVEAGNPRRITSLADLLRPGLVVALAGPAVPAGRYARQALARAGLAVPAASEEVDVKAVVQKIALGEADGGIVYATDGIGARVEIVEIPAGQNVVARLSIALLAEAANRALGEAFVAYAVGPLGQAVLARHGFEGPS